MFSMYFYLLFRKMKTIFLSICNQIVFDFFAFFVRLKFEIEKKFICKSKFIERIFFSLYAYIEIKVMKTWILKKKLYYGLSAKWIIVISEVY